MKILDRYIFFTYVKTFLSIFIILMFIFVLQSVWLYIQELAGRDLDFATIGKFLLYATPSLVQLVLPLSVLLTSIMTFGNFAENYEFAAMKSTGISLQRAMKSVIFFIVFLGFISFLFANYVIPASQYEFRNLRRNISQLKPSVAIRSGQFTEMGDDINIRVAEKSGDRDQYLTDVIIHQKEKRRLGNYTVIKAKKGELISSLDSPVVSLQLTDGNYYSEIYQRDYTKKRKEPFAKSYFKTYTLNIDLSTLDDVDLDNKAIDNSYQMFNVVELDSVLTDLSVKFEKDREEFSQKYAQKVSQESLGDRFKNNRVDSTSTEDVLTHYDTDDQVRILEIAKSNISTTLTDLDNQKRRLQVEIKRLNKFEISIHEKFVLGFSCILLFFVGAPLGAIIRKGGLGLPIVVGVVLFLTFHFIGIFAKNSAEDNSISPFVASWLSTFILLPLSIYLTYRATTDQGIFDAESFLSPLKRLFRKTKKVSAVPEISNLTYTLTKVEEEMLNKCSSNQLKDIVKNYREYDYTDDVRLAAIDRLGQLGITLENLRVQGYYTEEHS
nr:LptF/LptG family permease [Dokdonia sp. Hel_I_53]